MIIRVEEFNLPVDYTKLTPFQRKIVRDKYISQQLGQCFYCNQPLNQDPPKRIMDKPIDWSLFPSGFLKHPIHLQHSHKTGMTEGAVHAYCNAVMWQYEGK